MREESIEAGIVGLKHLEILLEPRVELPKRCCPEAVEASLPIGAHPNEPGIAQHA